MLIFNEGVPGSGKSYDALVEHILPAIKAGRRCYVRMKGGLVLDKIAEYLGMPLAEVEALVVEVPKSKVVQTFQADFDPDGDEYVVPEELRNALCIIDECHEAYVSSRNELTPKVEGFFAVHRHYGVDVVLMSQFYKRIHSALRGRIEGKNTFQKLTAVGMEKSFRVTFWRTTSPDRYEKVGGETRKYDPVYFPLYRGVADDAVKTDVYKGGSRTIWAGMAFPAVLVAVGVIVAGWYIYGFFSGDVSLFKESEAASAPVESAPADGRVFQRPEQVAQVGPAVELPPPDPLADLTPTQRYVFEMAKTARARVSAVVGEGAQAWGVIEFRMRNQPPIEVLNTRQLQAMGVKVTPTGYGFMLEAGGQTVVATQWPTHEIVRSTNHELYRLDRDGEGARSSASASEASAADEYAPTGVVGSHTEPSTVGRPDQGNVWGRAPATLRAAGQ